MSYWKTKGEVKFKMYKGEQPNDYWFAYVPDIDTENYYEQNGRLKNGKYAVIEINEDEI